MSQRTALADRNGVDQRDRPIATGGVAEFGIDIVAFCSVCLIQLQPNAARSRSPTRGHVADLKRHIASDG